MERISVSRGIVPLCRWRSFHRRRSPPGMYSKTKKAQSLSQRMTSSICTMLGCDSRRAMHWSSRRLTRRSQEKIPTSRLIARCWERQKEYIVELFFFCYCHCCLLSLQTRVGGRHQQTVCHCCAQLPPHLFARIFFDREVDVTKGASSNVVVHDVAIHGANNKSSSRRTSVARQRWLDEVTTVSICRCDKQMTKPGARARKRTCRYCLGWRAGACSH